MLIVFVTTFLVASYNRLSNVPVKARRSRHILGHGVKTVLISSQKSRGRQHEEKQLVDRFTGSRKSSTKNRTHFRKSSPAVQNVSLVTPKTILTSETFKSKSKSTGVTWHNVSTRLESQSPKGNRTSNKTRMFKSQLNPRERATLLTMFGVVTNALRASNVTFWMDGGTLLGSYRHHNLIPWDDDVDLVLRQSHKPQARRAINALAPAYQLFVEMGAAGSCELAWRVFATNASVPVTRKQYRFPTLDLHFYAQNASHVWLQPHNLWWNLVWRRSTVFPLYLRPFNRYWAPAPCNSSGYLIKEYGPQVTDVCRSPRMSHRNDIGQRQISMPCRMLRGVPIVNRKQDGIGSVTETLARGQKIVHRHVIHPKC